MQSQTIDPDPGSIPGSIRPRLYMLNDVAARLRLGPVTTDQVLALLPRAAWDGHLGVWEVDVDQVGGIEAVMDALVALRPGPAVGWDLRCDAAAKTGVWTRRAWIRRTPTTRCATLASRLDHAGVFTYERGA